MRILIIEDEAQLRSTLQRALAEEGHVIETAADGTVGLLQSVHGSFDLILLDVMLPDYNGWEILRTLRKKGNPTPVLMLTARDAVEDRVKGLDLGCDDYLPKPFDLSELLARVRALLRRAAKQPSPIVDLLGGVALDTVAKRVTLNGEAVDLTAREYALLEFLAARRGRVVTREQLEVHVLPDETDTSSNMIEVYVCNLRRKLGRELIETRRGMGYTMADV